MKKSETEIRSCRRKNPCVDCDDTACWFHGRKEANCPKYECDREGPAWLDCENCEFIDQYIESMRKNAGGKK